MKFLVSSSELSSRLQTISRVVNSKNSLPILGCFLFELKEGTLWITGSDGETSITTQLEVSGNDADGRFAIPADNFLDALREGGDQPLTFEVSMDTFEVTVNYQNGEYSLMAQNADVYPVIPEPAADSTTLKLPAEVLLNGISRTLFATADDELRPVMNGVFFDITDAGVTFVATDGHKLVRYKVAGAYAEGASSFILPKKPAGLLKNLLSKDADDTVVVFGDKNVVITAAGYQLVSRLIEGRYPNYNSVIPKNNPFKVIVDRQALASAARRVSIFSSQASSLIKFCVRENSLQLSTQDIDFSTSAQESVACQYAGSDMNIGFKAPYLIETLNNITSQDIVFELADPSRAGVLLPLEQDENVELLMLLMPMMLND